jgi:hypothetical protein
MCGRSNRFYKVAYFALVCILNSCSQTQTGKQGRTDTVSDVKSVKAKEIIVNDSTFLSLFPEMTGDTIHIFSPNDKRGGTKFNGKRIDPAFYKYFLFDDYLMGTLDSVYINIFSCYKIRLSDTRTGLIARIPGMYDSETAINLYLWDNQAKKIIGNFKLSDETGDAGWYFVKEAWLTDINNDNRLDILSRRKDRWDKDMDGMDGKERNTDSINVYIAYRDKFRKMSLAIDTARFQLFNW